MPASREPASRGAKPARPARASGSVVPSATIPGRSLALVIAIMTYLACLTTGGVSLVMDTASSWSRQVSSEVTIQIRPIEGVDAGAQAERAAEIAREMPGIARAQVLGQAENEALLAPWLGADLDLEELPVPRLVVLEVTPDSRPDMADLRARLADIRGASLDDHRMWQDRLRAMAGTFVALGLGVLSLVLVATILTVFFATRGAMASNRDIVAVLDLVGANHAFIAREFQRHFLVLALKGGACGGMLALATFVAGRWLVSRYGTSAGATQLDVLFGSFQVGTAGYAGALGVIAAVALLAAATSRLVVFNTLRQPQDTA